MLKKYLVPRFISARLQAGIKGFRASRSHKERFLKTFSLLPTIIKQLASCILVYTTDQPNCSSLTTYIHSAICMAKVFNILGMSPLTQVTRQLYYPKALKYLNFVPVLKQPMRSHLSSVLTTEIRTVWKEKAKIALWILSTFLSFCSKVPQSFQGHR